MKHLIFFAIIVIIQNGIINACDFTTCSTTKFHVCANETSFYRCNGTDPVLDTLFTCPTGLKCVDDAVRCSNGTAACESKCDKCDLTYAVACINKHEFNFCLGNIKIPELSGSCKEKYCDSSIPSICTEKAQSCSKDPPPPPPPPPTTPPTPPTPPPTPSTEEITRKCIDANKLGKFSGTDCTKYIYCRPSGNSIIGRMYTCPEQTYFNCTSQQCGSRRCQVDPSCSVIL